MTLEERIDRMADDALREVELSVDTALILCGFHPHTVARRRAQVRRYQRERQERYGLRRQDA